MSNQPGLGWQGGYLGYGPAFPKSVAVVFDLYGNSNWNDPAVPYMGIALNGDVTTHLTNTGTSRQFNNGNTWSCWVDYNGATQSLEVRLASTPTRPALATLHLTVNLLTTIGQSSMYLGFGAGAGGDYFLPVISAFSYAVTSIPNRETSSHHLSGLIDKL